MRFRTRYRITMFSPKFAVRPGRVFENRRVITKLTVCCLSAGDAFSRRISRRERLIRDTRSRGTTLFALLVVDEKKVVNYSEAQHACAICNILFESRSELFVTLRQCKNKTKRNYINYTKIKPRNYNRRKWCVISDNYTSNRLNAHP